MQYFLYILQCCDGSYYVGTTTDPAQRIQTHQSGHAAAYTAHRLPVALVYKECHPTLNEAVARERQIKRWSHGKKAALIAGDTAALHARAQRRRFRANDPA